MHLSYPILAYYRSQHQEQSWLAPGADRLATAARHAGAAEPGARRVERRYSRATGVGSELALASDMRFASREQAILSQWEAGAGLAPGGGPMARLPRLIGRGRALEVLLGADDIGGDVAERYGYVNRAVPDAELDAFVDALATRIASFDTYAIAETKHLVNRNSLPPDAEIAHEWDAFLASLGRPAAQARIRMLFERGFHQPGDLEARLGYHVGRLGVLPRSEERSDHSTP